MVWRSNDPDELGFLQEYSTLPDRTIGLLGVAMVERRLKMAIQAKWTDSPNGKMLGHLFRIDGGPFGVLGVQIEVGYAIGLYDWEVTQDLKTCQKIRNAFAHRISARDFSARQISDLCNNLQLPDRYKPRKRRQGQRLTLKTVLRTSAVSDLGTQRGRFSRTIEIIVTLLWGHLGFPKKLGKA